MTKEGLFLRLGEGDGLGPGANAHCRVRDRPFFSRGCPAAGDVGLNQGLSRTEDLDVCKELGETSGDTESSR